IGGFFNPQQPQDPNAPIQGPNQQNQNPWTTAAQGQQQTQPMAQGQQQTQPMAQGQQQPQDLNQNQQQAATKALDAIRAEFEKAMQNLSNSGDPTTQKLSQQFRDKIGKYMKSIQIKNGG